MCKHWPPAMNISKLLGSIQSSVPTVMVLYTARTAAQDTGTHTYTHTCIEVHRLGQPHHQGRPEPGQGCLSRLELVQIHTSSSLHQAIHWEGLVGVSGTHVLCPGALCCTVHLPGIPIPDDMSHHITSGQVLQYVILYVQGLVCVKQSSSQWSIQPLSVALPYPLQ